MAWVAPGPGQLAQPSLECTVRAQALAPDFPMPQPLPGAPHNSLPSTHLVPLAGNDRASLGVMQQHPVVEERWVLERGQP